MATRLSDHLSDSVFDSFRYVGTVKNVGDSKWSVTFSLPRAGNSYTKVLKGEIAEDGVGSSLSGTVGPLKFLGLILALCVGFLTLLLAVGIFLVAGSHRIWSAELLLVLVPLGLIGLLFGVTELATHYMQREWQNADEWLRTLLTE